eukprot:scaffold122302_cov39-Tisochrysis_lutea.AAC.6
MGAMPCGSIPLHCPPYNGGPPQLLVGMPSSAGLAPPRPGPASSVCVPTSADWLTVAGGAAPEARPTVALRRGASRVGGAMPMPRSGALGRPRSGPPTGAPEVAVAWTPVACRIISVASRARALSSSSRFLRAIASSWARSATSASRRSCSAMRRSSSCAARLRSASAARCAARSCVCLSSSSARLLSSDRSMDEPTEPRPGDDALSGEPHCDAPRLSSLKPLLTSERPPGLTAFRAPPDGPEYPLGGGSASSSDDDEPKRSDALKVLLRMPNVERGTAGEGGDDAEELLLDEAAGGGG